MTLRDILLAARELTNHGPVIITRVSGDYQIRLFGRDLMSVEMRYFTDNEPECPWFTFEGFSVDAVLADDWIIHAYPVSSQSAMIP